MGAFCMNDRKMISMMIAMMMMMMMMTVTGCNRCRKLGRVRRANCRRFRSRLKQQRTVRRRCRRRWKKSKRRSCSWRRRGTRLAQNIPCLFECKLVDSWHAFKAQHLLFLAHTATTAISTVFRPFYIDSTIVTTHPHYPWVVSPFTADQCIFLICLQTLHIPLNGFLHVLFGIAVLLAQQPHNAYSW